jgi:hypothetical protein
VRILYVIGNGFDLNLGLKTSYKDFYDYYQSIPSPNNKVDNLKKNISNNYKNWSDLELALGNYTQELKTLEEFDSVFEDIGENLAKYLERQEKDFNPKLVSQNKFFQNLVRPEDFLPVADRNRILTYKERFTNVNWSVDIFTFNYTTIIEKVIGSESIKVAFHPNATLHVRVNQVEHIHGYADARMVLGVNDLSQLKNIDFHNNDDVLEAIIKERCNKAHRHTIDNQFKEKILVADLICIFGSSIGDTDNVWWEQIGQRLKKEIPIIIFTKAEEVVPRRIAHKNNRTERKMRQYFFSKTKLTADEQLKVRENIYVAIDSLMFRNIAEK